MLILLADSWTRGVKCIHSGGVFGQSVWMLNAHCELQSTSVFCLYPCAHELWGDTHSNEQPLERELTCECWDAINKLLAGGGGSQEGQMGLHKSFLRKGSPQEEQRLGSTHRAVQRSLTAHGVAGIQSRAHLRASLCSLAKQDVRMLQNTRFDESKFLSGKTWRCGSVIVCGWLGAVGALIQTGSMEHLKGEPLGGAKQGHTSPPRAEEQLETHFGS